MTATSALVATSAVRPSAAQDARAETVAGLKAQKARALETPQPGLLERALNLVQEEAGAAPVGFYPYAASIYSGSWLAFGGGYRLPVGDNGVIDVEGAYSLRSFWRVQERVRLPRMATGRGTLQFRHTLLDAPQVRYFGIGPDASVEDRASFGFRRNEAVVEFRFDATDRFRVGADLGYESWNTRSGSGTDPSIEEVFDPRATPGLGADPAFLKVRFMATYDDRPSTGYARRGSHVNVSWTSYGAQEGQPFDFSRVDVAASRLIPVYRENWVIAVRGLYSATFVQSVNQVPFFLLPMLGESSDELRGYPAFRFRDRNRLLLTGEYRWMPSHYLDLALFLDAGAVAATQQDLGLGHMKTVWGVSARAHTPTQTLFHFTVGRGSEGWRYIVSAGQVF